MPTSGSGRSSDNLRQRCTELARQVAPAVVRLAKDRDLHLRELERKIRDCEALERRAAAGEKLEINQRSKLERLRPKNTPNFLFQAARRPTVAHQSKRRSLSIRTGAGFIRWDNPRIATQATSGMLRFALIQQHAQRTARSARLALSTPARTVSQAVATS